MSNILKPIVRKSPPPFDRECMDGALALATNVVESYSSFISTHSLGEHFVSDVTLLPRPKEIIISAYKLWLSYCATEKNIENCTVQFPLLANYQENIGVRPMDLFKRDIKISNKSLQEITTLLDRNTAPKIRANMDLMKIVFDERIKIDRIIHEYLYRGTEEEPSSCS